MRKCVHARTCADLYCVIHVFPRNNLSRTCWCLDLIIWLQQNGKSYSATYLCILRIRVLMQRIYYTMIAIEAALLQW